MMFPQYNIPPRPMFKIYGNQATKTMLEILTYIHFPLPDGLKLVFTEARFKYRPYLLQISLNRKDNPVKILVHTMQENKYRYHVVYGSTNMGKCATIGEAVTATLSLMKRMGIRCT